jgi:Uma2 family endonuclease
MEDTIRRPPRTIMEVYKLLPEGTQAEVIDGNIFMSPIRTAEHQKIVAALTAYMFLYSRERSLGEVYISLFDVFLDETANAVQPDIIFVTNNNLTIVREDGIHGSPDLLIEILSPVNESHDKVKKKALYEKFGVKEYWIIDPKTKEATGYFLENGSYVEFHKSIGFITSRLLNSTFPLS